MFYSVFIDAKVEALKAFLQRFSTHAQDCLNDFIASLPISILRLFPAIGRLC